MAIWSDMSFNNSEMLDTEVEGQEPPIFLGRTNWGNSGRTTKPQLLPGLWLGGCREGIVWLLSKTTEAGDGYRSRWPQYRATQLALLTAVEIRSDISEYRPFSISVLGNRVPPRPTAVAPAVR